MKNNCEEIRDNISAYIDGELYIKDRTDFEAHLSSCEECRSILAETKEIVATLHEFPEVEIPENFHQDIMRKLSYMSEPPIDLMTKKRLLKIKSSKSSRRGFNLRKIDVKKYSAMAASLLAGLLIVSTAGSFIGNITMRRPKVEVGSAVVDSSEKEAVHESEYTGGAGAEDDYSGRTMFFDENTSETSPAPQAAAAYSLLGDENPGTGEHLIKSYEVTVSVEDFDTALAFMETLPGYNAHSELRRGDAYGGRREASLSRRVSLGEYEIVKSRLKEMGEIIQESESEQRIDDTLSDLNIRLSAKESELTRLNSLLEQSRSMDVLAAVSRRISEVTTQRDDIKGSISGYQDKLLSPYVSIRLVTEDSGLLVSAQYMSFGEQIKNSFVRSANLCLMAMEGIMLFIASIMVPIVTIFIAAVIYVVSRRRLKRGEHNEK